ncbi:MAG: hypothetical protein DA328_05895 [Nitrososphaeraceae archaeon]|nr:hypothetical protein [Nitrososphaeraceae archaeon]
MRKIILFSIPIIMIAIIFFIINIKTNDDDYALDIDAMVEQQSLFTITKVIITNIGKLPSTNINIDYGTKNETLLILNPGEKVSVSPPEGSDIDVVKITTAEGLEIVKEYRKPIRMPGMMGS